MNKTLTEQFDENAAALLAQHNLMNTVYVVLTIIFIGILFYLIRLDRKISKLEKQS
jgi:CcmD family protein